MSTPAGTARGTAVVGLVLVAGLGCASSAPPAALPAAAPATAAPPTGVPSTAAPSAPATRAAVPLRTARPAGTATRSGPAAAPRPTAARLPLSGLVVTLDAGHDGGNASHPAQIRRQVPDGRGGTKDCNTTGTATDAGYAEHAFTFDVVARAALLRAQGARVVLTRSTDTGVGPCVDRRAAIGNAAGSGAVVSVHGDGAPASGRGFHVIEVDHGHTAADDRLARAVRAAVLRDTGTRVSTYTGGGTGITHRDDLAGLNLSRRPTVFVELANMRNAADARLVSSGAWRQRAAAAVADGVTAFLTGS